jgi:hypothetical protein
MITGQLTHPRIISALAAAGHGATVLITDGHYSAATAVGPNAETVHLNLQADFPTVPRFWPSFWPRCPSKNSRGSLPPPMQPRAPFIPKSMNSCPKAPR